MLATTVIGRGYVSCVVVHISKAPPDDPLVTRANLFGITVDLTGRGDYEQHRKQRTS
jgi:hypothetical protein